MSNKCHHFEITEMYRFDYFFPVVVIFFVEFRSSCFRFLFLYRSQWLPFFWFLWIEIESWFYFNEWIDHSWLVFILTIQSMMIMMMTIITHTHTWWKIPVCNDDRFFFWFVVVLLYSQVLLLCHLIPSWLRW